MDLYARRTNLRLGGSSMATLNANTTAARETAISISNVVDVMNPYGEQVMHFSFELASVEEIEVNQ
jgi:hypothetical protein